MSRWLVALGVLLASWGVWAETPPDPLAWLGRMAAAGQRLNYSGTFTYQSGNRSETSRIVHFRDGAGEFERLETLDGSPREVIRNNGEVRCVLPAQKTVIIDQAVDNDVSSNYVFQNDVPGMLAYSLKLCMSLMQNKQFRNKV